MIYSLDILLSQFGPVCCSMSSSNCWFLTCIQITQEAGQWSDIPISLKIFHSLLWSTQRLWHSQWSRNRCFSGILLLFIWYNACGNLISGSPDFSKANLNIWKFPVHTLLKPSLENFEHHFASMRNECNCAVVWTFFGIAFLWDWN